MQNLVNRSNLDRTIVMLLVTAAIALCLFAATALMVKSGKTLYLDDLLLTGLRSPAHPDVPLGSAAMLDAARDITALGDVTVLTMVTVVTLGYCLMTRYYTAFFMVFAAVNIGDLLMVLLKDLFQRHRPDIVPHLVAAAYTSFPSGHAMMSAIVYLTIGAILARIEPRRSVKIYLLAVFTFLPMVIGMSRVYLGVHYPSDVFAGWLAGISWGTLSAAVVLKVSQKLKSGAHE